MFGLFNVQKYGGKEPLNWNQTLYVILESNIIENGKKARNYKSTIIFSRGYGVGVSRALGMGEVQGLSSLPVL